jgi:hypothetical protein
MKTQETSQSQLYKEIDILKNTVKSLSAKMDSHRHDGFTSKIYFESLLFKNISQSCSFISLADDAELELVKTFGIGIVMAGTVDECAIFKFSTDGSVVLLANTTNVDDADTDGKLCIYDGGSKVKIKNRLGATKETRYMIFS